jgi:N-methylhydantoinase B
MVNSKEIDPITVSVIDNRLDAITKEMGETMLRTSRSPIFSEARDFVTALFDDEIRWVANTGYIPVIAGTTKFSQQAIADFFKDEIYEGDVFILNDPFSGNNHPPDVTVTRPVFYEGEIRFWAMAKGHHADVGGGGVAGYNPSAQTVWDDCFRIPPAKLYEKGEYRKDVWQMILKNVKIPFLVEGDLHCQVGATKIAERRLIELMEKYSPLIVKEALNEILKASEAHMKRELRKIPNGTYYAERSIDHDGIVKEKIVTIRLNLIVDDEKIVFDYSDTDPQVPGFLNSTYPNTYSSSLIPLFTSIDPTIKMNDGSTKPVEVIAPEGSLLNALEPAATTACTVPTCETITECGWIALSQAIPEKVQAVWARWCAPATAGINPKTQRPFAEIHFMSKGGGGATEGYDGWDHIGTVVCSGGLRSPDPELHEMVNPYTILEYELWKDSAGPGKWRGGFGVVYRWKVDGDNIPCAMFGSGIMEDTAPSGLKGGKRAPPYVLKIIRSDGTVIDADTNTFYTIYKGDIVEIYSSGGGGFGDPFEREPEKVLEDVRNELISIESAERDYGVVINPDTLEIDWERTEQLRSR